MRAVVSIVEENEGFGTIKTEVVSVNVRSWKKALTKAIRKGLRTYDQHFQEWYSDLSEDLEEAKFALAEGGIAISVIFIK